MSVFRIVNYSLDDDADDKLIVPKLHAYVLYIYSHLWFINALYGLYMNHYIHSLIPLAVGCTSLLYWNKPMYGWRRNIDMTVSIFSISYITYQHIDLPVWPIYVIIKILGYLSYYLSYYFYDKNQLELSTFLHMCVHLTAHSGCIMLFNRPAVANQPLAPQGGHP